MEAANMNKQDMDTDGINAFSFGEPESVLESKTDYLGVFCFNNKYFEPPVDLAGLAKTINANAHHGATLFFKRNQVAKWYKPNSLLKLEDLKKAALDFFTFGNAYLQKIYNPFGKVLRLVHIPAVNMRRSVQPGRYCKLKKDGKVVDYKKNEVVHLKEYDPLQSIYGIPEYFCGLNSVLLNEEATLFRRKYFKNGAHMGFIFYTADANLKKEDEAKLKEQISKSKGVGNFKSMFLNIPNGKPDSVKIIPIGDIATRDEFERVKNISRNDILAMHRVQPALAGVMPDNNGGFGDIEKISRVYYENEVLPMQQVWLQLNDIIPGNHIEFEVPKFADAA